MFGIRKIIAELILFSAVMCAVSACTEKNEEIITSSEAVSTEETTAYDTGTYEKLTYIRHSDHIEITDCDDTAEEVVIPAEIESLPVTVIGEQAFCDCTELKSVYLPDSIMNIKSGAFMGCSGLTAVIIPDSVSGIGRSAFSDCYSLISINIPENVTEISEQMFCDCKNLAEIKIPDSITSVGTSAFNGCSGLNSVTIPENVGNIGEYAFYFCENLTKIVIKSTECEISPDVISNGFISEKGGYYFDGTVYGYGDSSAQSYAEEYGFNFGILETYVLGDVNNDGIIDASDASCILTIYADFSTNSPTSFTETQIMSADTNGDMNVDVNDASLVLEYYSYVASGGTKSPDEFFADNIL